jgi:hypothetical protein
MRAQFTLGLCASTLLLLLTDPTRAAGGLNLGIDRGEMQVDETLCEPCEAALAEVFREAGHTATTPAELETLARVTSEFDGLVTWTLEPPAGDRTRGLVLTLTRGAGLQLVAKARQAAPLEARSGRLDRARLPAACRQAARRLVPALGAMPPREGPGGLRPPPEAPDADREPQALLRAALVALRRHAVKAVEQLSREESGDGCGRAKKRLDAYLILHQQAIARHQKVLWRAVEREPALRRRVLELQRELESALVAPRAEFQRRCGPEAVASLRRVDALLALPEPDAPGSAP